MRCYQREFFDEMERQRWRKVWRSGRVRGTRTWTVIDGGIRTVAPVEEWLEAHRHLWSPNTVRGYATALAQWWTFLEQRGETGGGREVGVPAVTGFLSWLRNGRTVEHALVGPGGASVGGDVGGPAGGGDLVLPLAGGRVRGAGRRRG